MTRKDYTVPKHMKLKIAVYLGTAMLLFLFWGLFAYVIAQEVATWP